MKLPETVAKKLADLPDKPGCYIMRDRFGRIIYVGKAASLAKRVRSYFRRSSMRSASPKIAGLVESVADLEWIAVRTEAEAILTEGRLIKQFRPRYNTTFKDDKRFLLLRVNLDEPFPRIEAVRIKRNDGANYFGPFASSAAARTLLKFAAKRFGIRVCRPRLPGPEDHKHCLDDIVRNCSAPCKGAVSPGEYAERVRQALSALSGGDRDFIKRLESEMEEAAQTRKYEEAAFLRDALRSLRMLSARARLALGARTPAGAGAAAIEELARLLELKKTPRVIEAFDVSCIVGVHAVASMVCAIDGAPRPEYYRRFRIKTVSQSDDPAMMAEAVSRRIGRLLREGRPLPDLLLVDGGLTQLRAARSALPAEAAGAIEAIGLAKRYEEVYLDNGVRPDPLRLPEGSVSLLLLRRIRDEAHRFALAYHRKLRDRRIRESALDEIPGIGPERKERLLSHFGSVARIAAASERQIAAVPGVGAALAGLVKRALCASRCNQ